MFVLVIYVPSDQLSAWGPVSNELIKEQKSKLTFRAAQSAEELAGWGLWLLYLCGHRILLPAETELSVSQKQMGIPADHLSSGVPPQLAWAFLELHNGPRSTSSLLSPLHIKFPP